MSFKSWEVRKSICELIEKQARRDDPPRQKSYSGKLSSQPIRYDSAPVQVTQPKVLHRKLICLGLEQPVPPPRPPKKASFRQKILPPPKRDLTTKLVLLQRAEMEKRLLEQQKEQRAKHRKRSIPIMIKRKSRKQCSKEEEDEEDAILLPRVMPLHMRKMKSKPIRSKSEKKVIVVKTNGVRPQTDCEEGLDAWQTNEY